MVPGGLDDTECPLLPECCRRRIERDLGRRCGGGVGGTFLGGGALLDASDDATIASDRASSSISSKLELLVLSERPDTEVMLGLTGRLGESSISRSFRWSLSPWLGIVPGRVGSGGAFSSEKVDEVLERIDAQELTGGSGVRGWFWIGTSESVGFSPPATDRGFRGTGGMGRGFAAAGCMGSRTVEEISPIGFRWIELALCGKLCSFAEILG